MGRKGYIKLMKARQALYETAKKCNWNFTNKNNFICFENIMSALDWSVKNNEYGNICDIKFDGEKYTNDDKIFRAIQSYVEVGSYIVVKINIMLVVKKYQRIIL